MSGGDGQESEAGGDFPSQAGEGIRSQGACIPCKVTGAPERGREPSLRSPSPSHHVLQEGCWHANVHGRVCPSLPCPILHTAGTSARRPTPGRTSSRSALL